MRPVVLSSFFKVVHPALGSIGRRSFCKGAIFQYATSKSVLVRVGGSGDVQLNIDHPPKTATSTSSPNHILVILPPGPSLFSSSSVTTLQTSTSLLRSILPVNTTLITLQYRLPSHENPYPLPIHDTATAFQYISSPTSPHNRNRNRITFPWQVSPRISLLGTHIGGALALMLALTEPKAIHSIAAIEPLTDWVGIDGPPTMKLKSELQDKEAHAHLLHLRSTLFPSPGAYFDPFASPSLFLRAPGRDTPLEHGSLVTEDEDDFLSSIPNRFSPYTNSHDTPAQAYGPYDDDLTLSPRSPSPIPTKRRKVLRRWPPVGRPEQVMLPYTRIFVREAKMGLGGILRAQGEEMVELMRRACFWGREKGVGEERVGLGVLRDGEIGVDAAGRWLRGIMEQGGVE